jgi:hypothetical protein
MHRRPQLSVECVPAMLRPAMPQAVPPGIACADSPRRPEGGLSKPFRSAWLAFCMAFALTLSAPELFALQPEPSSTHGKQDASAPAPPPAPQPAAAGAGEGMRLAQAQGRAETAAVDWVLANSGPLVGDTPAGEFRVAFTVTPAEGWWDKAGGGKLVWHEAPANNVHLRIFVLNLADGRLVPGLSLRATLIDANGNEQAAPVDFGWYPLINAYGGNLPLAADSSYTLRVAIAAGAASAARPPSSEGGLTRTTVAEFPPVPIAQNAVLLLPLATATATANEAELLRPCNAALRAAITALWQQSASGAEKPSGDYFVAFALDDFAHAMPLTGRRMKHLLEFTGKENVRLEVLVRDSRTGRLIPGLKPQASLVADDGSFYDPGALALTWHSWLNHYGRNARIPRKGLYRLLVSFDAPGFRRWGRPSERFASPAELEFDNLSLKPEGRTNP